VLPLALCASAEDKPDFSGTWILNVSKSDFGVQLKETPPSRTMVIEQTGNTITLKTILSAVNDTQQQRLPSRVKKMLADAPDTISLKTDGTETRLRMFGQDTGQSLEFAGDTLVIKSYVYDSKHTIISRSTDIWVLSPDGNVLTDTQHSSFHVPLSSDFESNQKMVFERQCDSITADPTTDFREAVLAVLHAAEEPDPFGSIRGDFDLSAASDNRQWKTSFKLPHSEKCSLIKVPSTAPGSAALWTFACTFRAMCNGYEGVVKAMQSVLKLSYQPDEGASINQVFLADPSKPTWRSFVTKIDEARVGIWFVAIRPGEPSSALPRAEQLFPALKTSHPGERPSVASNASSVAADGSISAEIEKIRSSEHVPFPPIQPIGGVSSAAAQSGTGAFAVKNDTAYTLTVLFSGPTERRVDIAPGASLSIEIPPGAYKVAARVNTPDVAPSYGEHVFDRSSAGVTFYIQ